MAWLRWTRGFAAIATLGIALGVGTSSCAEAEGRFFIRCISDAEGCSCETQVAEGSFNAAACGLTEAGDPMGTCGYSASFVLFNGMISSLDFEANNNKVETSEIIVHTVDLSFESNGGTLESQTGIPMYGLISPESETCLTLGLLGGDADIGEGDIANVVVTVKFYGRTTGGLEVETPTQYVPFTIYNDPNDCSCGEAEAGAGSNGVKIACATGCE